MWQSHSILQKDYYLKQFLEKKDKKAWLTASDLGLTTFMNAPLARASISSFLVTFLVSRNFSWGNLYKTKYL